MTSLINLESESKLENNLMSTEELQNLLEDIARKSD